MINAFTSSAIEALTVTDDGTVNVTFTGGREYTYAVADVNKFQTEFNAAASKGRYFNESIQNQSLRQLVAA